MSSDQPLQKRFIEIGLADPFIRTIVGVVAIAVAASFVVSIIGDAIRAVLAVGLSMMFGVVLVVLRVLMKHADDKIVWVLCIAASGVIVFVFIALIIFAVPAVIICQPRAYSQTLGLKACATALEQIVQSSFTPADYTGSGITHDVANQQYDIRVFYRPARQTDAERVVGAFLRAGYRSTAVASSLNEVETSDRSPGLTLIKTTTAQQARAAELARITKLALPLGADRVSLFPRTMPSLRGDAQIDLF